MTVSVNTIPSVSVPLTDRNGRINRIWHEFLRQFVAESVDGTISGAAAETSITAGNGLTGGGTGAVTLNIGQGSGIAVNADDVSVDINNQTNIIAALDDELLLSDKSDNNAIRKTTVRNVMELSAPGGADTYVQYNDNGVFGGDSGLTYDGAGTLGADTVTPTTTDGDFTLAMNGTGITRVTGTNPIISGSGGSSTTRNINFSGNNVQITGQSSTRIIAAAATGWNLQADTGKTLALTTDAASMTGIPFCRTYTATQTASTTQTQGQGALTNEYNLITTVANANDTVTLPSSLAAAHYCVVCNAGANILKVFPSSGTDLGSGTNVATYISPGGFMAWVAFDTFTWRPVGGRTINSVRAGITASTTQTQGQQPLTEDVNEISVCANANDTVTLPSAPTYSRTVKIINNGAQTLQIFPASGDNLGAGADTATTLASGSNVSYTNYDATNWESV